MDSALISANFKVPKLKTKKFLDPVKLNSNQFTSEILPKIIQSYIKPKLSENCFKFINGWLIRNTQSENAYITRRHLIRKEIPNAIETIGFVFVKSQDSLIDLARKGLFRIGNLSESFLSIASSGVSVCQHADVYHPGTSAHGVPKFGYLVLCKYLKSRINFVQFDQSPMEPQPQFDCHMLKSNTIIDNHANVFNAFHKTQVFIYEYSEDGEIVKYPSQILPFAAVEFKWFGDYLYRISEVSISKSKSLQSRTRDNSLNNVNSNIEKSDSSKIKNTQRTEKDLQSKPIEPKCLSRFLSIDNSIHRLNSTFQLPCQIYLTNNKIEKPVEVKITCTVYMYMVNPIVFPQLYSSRWHVTDVLEISEFEKELKFFQFHLQDKITKSSTDLLDPLSYDIIISKTSPTLLTISENQVNESFLYSNDTIPKYATYMRLVPDNSKLSRFNTLKLIDHFRNTKTVGRISFGSTTEISYKILIFFFPDGKFSKKLGINSATTDDCYFHGLILHFQHPEFTICNLEKDSLIEKLIYFTGLSSYKKQSVAAKFSKDKSIIDLNVLKETCNEQGNVQKTFFSHLLKPVSSSDPLVIKYSTVFPCSSDLHLPNNNGPDKISINDVINIYTGKIISTIKKKLPERKSATTNGSISSQNLHKKSTKKRKISENETKELENKLYNMLKSPLENLGDLENESQSEKVDNESPPIEINHVSQSFDLDREDLIPCRNDFAFTNSLNGSFNELIFMSENCARVNNSSSLMFVEDSSTKPLTQCNRFERIWTFNRNVFRKVKHITGLSFYDG